MVSNNLVKPENTLQPSLFAARNVPVKRTVPSGVERGQTAVFICVQPRPQANSCKASQQRRLGTHRDSSRPGKKWQKSLISEKKGLDDCSTKNLLFFCRDHGIFRTHETFVDSFKWQKRNVKSRG